ncbi:MAG: alpha/beta hydrolase [Clostridiales bacterium]|nr:alpha/beta hydrolase [Clostridiales bacterium]
MKKLKYILIISIVILGFITVIITHNFNSKKDYIVKNNTITGNVVIINNFYSPELKNSRTLRIYLPKGYEKSKDYYPVIYMLDGQTLFSDDTSLTCEWQVDETIENLISEGKTRGAIVVGIDSIREVRTTEYNPFKTNPRGNQEEQLGGKCKEHSDFLVNTIMPYINNNYRTIKSKESTGIIGASFGAVASLYTAIENSDKFGFVGVFSMAGGLTEKELNNYLKDSFTKEKFVDTTVYFYAGTNDNVYYYAENAYKIGINNKVKNMVWDEDQGEHSAYYWRYAFKRCINKFNCIFEN